MLACILALIRPTRMSSGGTLTMHDRKASTPRKILRLADFGFLNSAIYQHLGPQELARGAPVSPRGLGTRFSPCLQNMFPWHSMLSQEQLFRTALCTCELCYLGHVGAIRCPLTLQIRPDHFLQQELHLYMNDWQVVHSHRRELLCAAGNCDAQDAQLVRLYCSKC